MPVDNFICKVCSPVFSLLTYFVKGTSDDQLETKVSDALPNSLQNRHFSGVDQAALDLSENICGLRNALQRKKSK